VTTVFVATATLLFWHPSVVADRVAGGRAAEPEDQGTIMSYAAPRPWPDGNGTSASTPRPTAAAAAATLPSRSGDGRRIVYSLSRQRLWLVNDARQVERTYLVSGRLDQPGSGTYRVYSKSRHARSAIGPERMEHMVRFARGHRTGAPIGFHSIPVHISTGRPAQRLDQLGKPISAGCIRQRPQDAAYLWGFAAVGTKVVVTR
jgi:hypothetical protein